MAVSALQAAACSERPAKSSHNGSCVLANQSTHIHARCSSLPSFAVPVTRLAYDLNRWRVSSSSESFHERRTDEITGEAQAGESLHVSPAIYETISITHMPSSAEA